VSTGAVPDTPDDPVETAAQELAAGRPVLVEDDVAGEGAAVVIAAERCNTRAVAFLVQVTSGLVCVAMTGTRLDELRIPPLATPHSGPHPSAFAVSVDLRTGISTGISARDRALTVQALADAATRPADLVRPGHVLPVRVDMGGVLERPRPAEAAVELCATAGLAPAAAFATAVDAAGELVGPAGLAVFANEHRMALVQISQVVAWRRRREPPVRGGATITLPTVHGRFSAVGYGGEHLALVRGDLSDLPGATPVLVRVHDECLAGDVLGSLRCRCAARLAASLSAIDQAGRGVLVYLRSRTALGIGLVHPLRGCTVRDERAAAVAAHVLGDLGVRRALLLTDDPTEAVDLRACGLDVAGHLPLLPAGVPTSPAAEVG
jgi:3,4-dihydroxy 2-butanone 4-phosphate synthase/GTP cyclohydrolase II